jgi:hypothetical protein
MEPEAYGVEPAPQQPSPDVPRGPLERDVICVQCSYNLRGLKPESRCPECGTIVLRSLQGNLLKFSSAEYLAKLHLGVFIILAAIVAQFLLLFAMIALGFLGMTNAQLMGAVEITSMLAGVGVGIAQLLGWWLFSEEDPGVVGTDKGSTARTVVRASVIVLAGLTLLGAVVTLTMPLGTAGQFAVMILQLGAQAVMFFASMLYLRWLAPRLPNPRVHKRAGLLMWLGPLLMTVGMLACGVGPLIALVLYWNMLDWVRRDIKAIRESQATELAHLM